MNQNHLMIGAFKVQCPACYTFLAYPYPPYDLLLACPQCNHAWSIPAPLSNIVFNPDAEAWQAMVRLATAEQQYEAMWELVAWTADLLQQRSAADVRDWLRALLANR